MSQEDHTVAWIGIGIGILIGGLFAFLILREKPALQTQTMQPPAIDAGIFNQFIEDIRRLSEENATLKFQLSRPPAISYPVPQVVETSPPWSQAPVGNTAYKNKEQWEIERTKEGRIKGIKVLRDVKVDGTAGAAG